MTEFTQNAIPTGKEYLFEGKAPAAQARSGISPADFPVETPEQRQAAAKLQFDLLSKEVESDPSLAQEPTHQRERARAAELAGISPDSLKTTSAPKSGGGAPAWTDVVRMPEMQKLDSEQLERARNRYFLDVVAPVVPTDQLSKARAAFDADTKPGPINRAVRAARDAVSQIGGASMADWARRGLGVVMPGAKVVADLEEVLGNPQSEATKGMRAGISGAHQMGAAAAMVPVVGAIANYTRQLERYDAVDQGEQLRQPAGARFGVGGNDPLFARALEYQQANPDRRQQIREEELKKIGDLGETKKGLAEAWKTYSADAALHQGRTPNFTDINDVKNFTDWFAFNFGQGLPYMGATAMAGLLGTALGGPAGGVAAIGTTGMAMGLGDVASSTLEKGREINPDAAALASVPYAALEFLGPVGRAFRMVPKPVLEQAAGSYLKRLGKEVGANAVEEFINEAGQEIVKDVAVAQHGEPIVTEDALKNWLNAGMAGAAAGAPFGAASTRPGSAAAPAAAVPAQQAAIAQAALPPGRVQMGEQPQFDPEAQRRSDEAQANADAVYAARDAEEQRQAALRDQAAQPAAAAAPAGDVKSMLADPKVMFEEAKNGKGIFATIRKAMRETPEYKAAPEDAKFDLDAAVASLQADPNEIFRLAKTKPEVYATIARVADQTAKLEREPQPKGGTDAGAVREDAGQVHAAGT